MKSSYKLLGKFWDRLDVTDTITFLDDDIFINYIDDEYNLFDLKKIRKINLSEILKIKNEDELKQITNKILLYNSLLIVIDFSPIDNQIIESFYCKRLLQIYNYFNNIIKDDNVYLSNNCKQYFIKNNLK